MCIKYWKLKQKNKIIRVESYFVRACARTYGHARKMYFFHFLIFTYKQLKFTFLSKVLVDSLYLSSGQCKLHQTLNLIIANKIRCIILWNLNRYNSEIHFGLRAEKCFLAFLKSNRNLKVYLLQMHPSKGYFQQLNSF